MKKELKYTIRDMRSGEVETVTIVRTKEEIEAMEKVDRRLKWLRRLQKMSEKSQQHFGRLFSRQRFG